MSAENSTEFRQKFEFEALTAIYGKDLKDLREKPVWNQWRPLNLQISLIPQQGNSGVHEIYATVDLRVICSQNYPNIVPKLLIENSKGLSDNDKIQLIQELNDKAETLKGEEMIFQLCQHAQEFLHYHNKPTSKSFYDEMLQRQKEKEVQDLQAKQLEEQKRKQFMMEEIKKRQDMLKSEAKLRKEHRYNSENSNEDLETTNTSFANSEHNGEDCSCTEKMAIAIDFGSRKIQRGRCIKHFSPFHVEYMGIDSQSGEILVVSEWIIATSTRLDHSTVIRQLSSIDQEFNYLSKLKHSNLIHYVAFKHCQDENGFIVHALKEFVYGSNCAYFMKRNLSSNLQFIKYVCKGLLAALDYLHRNNVVHKNLNEFCVYINEKGLVQLSNYSIHRRLTDLCANSNGSNYFNKKTDIFKFGIFVLSLYQCSAVNCDDDGNDVDLPRTLPTDLFDFLSKCLYKEKERFTTTQLLNHQYFNDTHPETPPQHHNQVANVRVGNESPDLIQNEILNQIPTSGPSRIENEFAFLQFIGKGAFGDVIKVCNRLDGRNYAIKRIKLNPKNKTLRKKIVREVKLLSRLNHENVVRYFNSWIERSVIKNGKESSQGTSELFEAVPKIVRKDELKVFDNVEELAPPINNVEISITYDSKSQRNLENSSSSDSDDDNWGVYNEESDSDSIEFEGDANEEPSCTSKPQELVQVETVNEVQIEFMYIQMELCEKSTLRNAIDDNLYKNEDRVWRLFREIVEGLTHIHQQGMIHRDLKPVNIFLDGLDHVKIGDFGLATNIKSRINDVSSKNLNVDQYKEETNDESKTGLVGTALYVAPELESTTKTFYNQKVDIYSLGVIFFEMCFRASETTMERIKVLTGIRSKEILLPDEFIARKNSRQEFIIRWLLDHEMSKRPTAQDLLESEHLPPPVLEERELRELVRNTLSNPQLKGYKYLIASCFDQEFPPVQDVTYDRDPNVNYRPLILYEFVRQVTVDIFKKHGGQNLSTPLLMPKCHYYDGVDSCVKLMTHFGGIVSLPHDLRVPFARFLAWNGVTFLRRYSIERVYREKKVFGFVPRELYECAFDIVTPTQGNLMSDAEILYIVYEIINALPGVRNKNFVIRLNHSLLLKSILLHFGVKDHNHKDICKMVQDMKDGKIPKHQMHNYLTGFCLSDSSISALINIFNSEYEITKAANNLQSIIKKKTGDASYLAKQALQELKTISQNAEAFGVDFEMVIAPGMVYNIQQYSGMICQFVFELKKKHKPNNLEVLAAGGRYDSMITKYRNMTGRDLRQSAIGVSISLDKLVQASQREQKDDWASKLEFLDVAVCSTGTKPLIKEKTSILRNLWSANIRSALIDVTNFESILEQCAELRVPYVIMLKDSEQGTVRLGSWERDRFQEKTVKTNEIVETIQKFKLGRDAAQDCVTLPNQLSKSDSKTNYNEHSNEPNVSVLFVTVDKLSSNARKRYETQIRSHLNGLFKKLSGYVIVLGLSTERNIIRTLSSLLEFESEQLFQKSVENVIEKHQRHKKYLIDVCDEIYEQKTKRTDPIIILFCLMDSFFKVIT